MRSIEIRVPDGTTVAGVVPAGTAAFAAPELPNVNNLSEFTAAPMLCPTDPERLLMTAKDCGKLNET
jgi:hypothetical protein